jgi:hypothetical protein
MPNRVCMVEINRQFFRTVVHQSWVYMRIYTRISPIVNDNMNVKDSVFDNPIQMNMLKWLSTSDIQQLKGV